MTNDQLAEHYKAVYAALNQFWPIPGRDDLVAVNLKALALVLDNPPVVVMKGPESPHCPTCSCGVTAEPEAEPCPHCGPDGPLGNL